MSYEYEKVWEGGRALESKMIEQDAFIMTTIITLVKANVVVGQFHLDEGEGKDVSYYLNPEHKPLHEPLTRGRIGIMRLDQAQQQARWEHEHGYGGK